jgi:hypothetical protein
VTAPASALNLLNDVRHRERLARSRHTQQHLSAFVIVNAIDQFIYGFGLVASRSELTDEFKLLILVRHESGIAILAGGGNYNLGRLSFFFC